MDSGRPTCDNPGLSQPQRHFIRGLTLGSTKG
jgi:hypothetical protein